MQGNIVFEQRAVAYIDVLGFKQLVNQSDKNSEFLLILSDLVKLLVDEIPTYNRMARISLARIPRYTTVSDSIILSTPLENESMLYDGLITVVLRSIELILFLLNKGFLVRGGISVGNFYHDESQSIIVGPAYQEAVAIEESISTPCIMLSDSAMKYYTEILSPDWREWCQDMFVCNGYYSNLMVNGINSAYYRHIFKGKPDEDVYRCIQSRISEQFDSQTDFKVRGKWFWFWNYFYETVKKIVC